MTLVEDINFLLSVTYQVEYTLKVTVRINSNLKGHRKKWILFS